MHRLGRTPQFVVELVPASVDGWPAISPVAVNLTFHPAAGAASYRGEFLLLSLIGSGWTAMARWRSAESHPWKVLGVGPSMQRLMLSCG
jgi:hypothetical protein